MKRFLSKFASTKWLVTLWAMAIVTYMVVADKVDDKVAPVLVWVPVAYCGLNVAQKGILGKAGGGSEAGKKDGG